MYALGLRVRTHEHRTGRTATANIGQNGAVLFPRMVAGVGRCG